MSDEQRLGPITRLRLAADAVLVVVLAIGAVQALGFTELARYMPLFAASLGTVLAIALFSRDFVRGRRLGGDEIIASEAMDTAVLVDEDRSAGQGLRQAALQLCWMLVFPVAIAVLGVLPAAAVFVAVFLYVEGNMRWYFVALSSVVTVGMLSLFGNVMSLTWPETIWERLGG